MVGSIDRYIDGWMDAWVDGWVYGSIDRCKYEWIDQQTRRSLSIDTYIHVCIWINRRIDR